MRDRPAVLVLALAALGLVVRVGWVLVVDPEVPEVGDATAYHLLADGLAGGHGYVRPFDRVLFDLARPTAEYPPLHPAVLAVADAAGVDSVTGQRLWLSLFGAASVAVTALAARRLSGGSTAATVAAGLLAAAGPLWFQPDATLMPETLTALLGALALLAALHVRTHPTAVAVLALGASCGLAVLARTDAVVLVPIAAVAAGSWRRAAAVVATAGVVVAPWLVRDLVTFDTFVPVSTNAGSVLDGANCPDTYGGPLVGSWVFGPECFEGFTQDELAADDEAAVSAAHRAQGVEYATSNAGRWPLVATARLARTLALWNPAQQADLGRLEGRQQGAELAGYAVLWATVAAAAVAAVRRRPPGWWIPAAIVLAVWLSTALSYGNPRFLAAAHPALAALAAAATPVLWQVRGAGRHEPAKEPSP